MTPVKLDKGTATSLTITYLLIASGLIACPLVLSAFYVIPDTVLTAVYSPALLMFLAWGQNIFQSLFRARTEHKQEDDK